jgi:hypothetical protein
MEIAIALLQHYSFDLGGYTIKDLTRAWGGFKTEWVRQAVIESLFQGRYKAVSVNQILQSWERKGEPNCRYNREFERLVCGDVAVIYEDKIFYTAPRNTPRQSSISTTNELANSESSASSLAASLVFPKRSMIGGVKLPQDSPAKVQRYPSRPVTPSGTTAPSKVYPAPPKIERSEVFRTAYQNMTLLAESSMFVDKLRLMCSDRLVLPAPKISSENDNLESNTMEVAVPN